MVSMCFCDGCGRSIDSTFIYCPWCGKSTLRKDDTESLENFAETVEEKKRDEQAKTIEKMEKQLEDLERELSILVLSAEMHR